MGDFGYGDVTRLANAAMGEDRDGYRKEFVSLVALAKSLTPATDASKVSRISE